MNRIKNMTSGNPAKLIFFFALPLMLGNIGQQLYTVVDAVIVSRGVGVHALAALGATDWLCWMVLWVAQSFAQGFSIQITQRFGAQDRPGVRKAIAMSVLLGLGLALVLTVAALLGAGPVLRLLNTPADIYDAALSYCITLLSGTVAVFAFNLAASILRAFGNSTAPLAAMLLASGVNIALDLVFVLGFGWGIVGAAVATVIAQLASFLYCLLVLRQIDAARPEKADWRPDAKVMKKLMGLGFPLALQHGFIALGGMILQSVINGFGSLVLAGFTATNKLYGILECAAGAFGFATSTYIGQNYGAGRLDRIDAGIRSVVRLAVSVSLGISAVMLVVGRYVLRLFVPEGEAYAAQVLDIAQNYLLALSVFLVALYLLHAYRSALQGLGNTVTSLVSGVIEFVMRVGTALLLPPLVGTWGIFLAEPAAWTGSAVYLIISYYRMARRIKRAAALAEGTPPPGP